MGYENVLFNGKSMRNAIITKLSEDKHLTSALFANSNITILIDILSYMYQCLMANLRQAASESMWSDTIFFENATRLARLIGYYAKGQIPFTMLAKLVPMNDETAPTEELMAPDFGTVSLGYGPYEFNFAVVEHNVNGDQSIVKLALGDWKLMHDDDEMVSDGTKFQEFVIQNKIDNYDMPSFISQKYVRVFSKCGNEKAIEWKYSPDPLFLIQNGDYTPLDAEGATGARTLIASENDPKTNLFNFYINENGDYILKFGDGLSTSIPKLGSKIYVFYVSSTETEATITQAMKSALINSSASEFTPFQTTIEGLSIYDFFEHMLNDGGEIETGCIPSSVLSGFRRKDNAESIRRNSRAAFSRQNRLVTKEDYKTFLLENNSQWADIVVQNNWEYVSSFYGWLYAISKEVSKRTNSAANEKTKNLLDVNQLQPFNSSDLADANNIYVWVLEKYILDSDKVDIGNNVGVMTQEQTGIDKTKSGNSLGAIKDITEHPIFLYALCKRFGPFAGSVENLRSGIVDYDNPDPFKNFASYFRIHVDSTFANNLNEIKAKTISYFKSYLFDNIKLGYTPNISALIKDIMAIDGVINVTTVFNEKDENIETEQEVNGMRFCTWTDTNHVLLAASDDADVGFNLPNIPCFQYFKAAQSYKDFIANSLKFKIDYSLKS